MNRLEGMHPAPSAVKVAIAAKAKTGMRKTALLLGILALCFSASVRSDQPNANPRYVFEVSLTDTLPIRFSPRIHPLAPKDRYLLMCFDCMRDLEPGSFAFSLDQDAWTLVPMCAEPFAVCFN